MKKLKLSLYILLLFVGTVLLYPQPTYAHQISPAFKEIDLKKGKTYEDKVTFKNTTDQTLKVKIKAYPYNNNKVTKEKEIKEVIINPQIESITVKANQKIEIPYKIEADTGLRNKTYYNTLAIIEETSSTEKKDFSLPQGLGVIFRVNIFENQDDFIATVTEDTKLNIEITNINVFEGTVDTTFTITNNSPYTLRPIGSLVMINKKRNRFPTKQTFNEKENLLKANKSISRKYTFTVFDPTKLQYSELRKLFETYTIGAKIHITPKIEKKTLTEFSIYQTYKAVFIFIGIFLIVILLLMIRKFLYPPISKLFKVSTQRGS